MEDDTSPLEAQASGGKIVIAVTIFGSAPPTGVGGGAHPEIMERTIELAPESLQGCSAEGLHETLRRAIAETGDRKPAETPANVTVGLPSDWERLIEYLLQTRPNDIYAQALAIMERQLLTRVLDHAGGNQSRAARILGITRGCLRDKIRTLGITISHSVRSEIDHSGR
jgi:transcriptional regulator with GAF, ATPase, and Fis domain